MCALLSGLPMVEEKPRVAIKARCDCDLRENVIFRTLSFGSLVSTCHRRQRQVAWPNAVRALGPRNSCSWNPVVSFFSALCSTLFLMTLETTPFPGRSLFVFILRLTRFYVVKSQASLCENVNVSILSPHNASRMRANDSCCCEILQ